jgi:hypothetical protein
MCQLPCPLFGAFVNLPTRARAVCFCLPYTLQELDFVAANVMMAIIADFMLVWLPAPTMSFAGAAAARKAGLFDVFGRIFAGCPDNAFQKVQPGMPTFTLLQVGSVAHSSQCS